MILINDKNKFIQETTILLNKLLGYYKEIPQYNIHGIIIHARKKYFEKIKNTGRDKPLYFFYGDLDYLTKKISIIENTHSKFQIIKKNEIIDVPETAIELMFLPFLNLKRIKLKMIKELVDEIDRNDVGQRKVERLLISVAHKFIKIPLIQIDIDKKVSLETVKKIAHDLPIDEYFSFYETPNGWHINLPPKEEYYRAIYIKKILKTFPFKIEVSRPNHLYLPYTRKGNIFVKYRRI